MRKRYIYVSGPMTGLPKLNKPAFNRAAKQLRKLGYKVISPPELDAGEPCDTWEDNLRRDLRILIDRCYAVATLPGWKKSRGAKLETHVARKLFMPIKPVEYWLNKGRR